MRNPLSPLLILAFWKCEAHQTDLRIDYRLNPDCPLEPALLNLQFLTQINGNVDNVVSKPDAEWSPPSERLIWRMTELSKHGEPSGALKARMTVSRGPSNPTPTHVQFTASEGCLSGLHVETDADNYRLSLLKKKLVSGKFLCEPDAR